MTATAAENDPHIICRNALAVRWLPLVHRIARDFRRTRVERDDLLGIGRLALVIACNTADPDNARLVHYLAHPIRRTMRDEAYRRAHLRHEWAAESPEFQPDRSPGPGSRAERDDEARAARALVGRLLPALPARERLVVRLVFGLGGDEPMTETDLADELGVSRALVWKLLQRALRRMEMVADGIDPARCKRPGARRDAPRHDPAGE